MATTERVLVIGWDGFRPDLMTRERTPNLFALAEQGARFARSTAVFPSETRPNAATIGTGTLPGRHGITANHVHAPEVVAEGLLNTGNHNHLMAIATAPNGPRRIVAPRTMGELLTEAGRRVAFLSSGSPGQALLQNPSPFAGWTIHPVFTAPNTLGGKVRKRFGDWPAKVSGQSAGAIDDHLERIAFEMVVPELDPELLVMWSCEPDSTFHYWGIGSPQAEAAIRANDARLGRVLARIDLARTTVFFLSDHGQSTLGEAIDLPTELLRGGIRRLARPNDVAVVAHGVQLAGGAVDQLPKLCAFLRERRWCGPIFVRDDRWDASLTGTLPVSTIWGGSTGRWVPDVQFSTTWDDQPNEHGVPGRTPRIGRPGVRPMSGHGSLAPWDATNTMLLAGAGVPTGVLLETPASTADVAPTILEVLGVERGPEMQGRALGEAFDKSVPEVTTEALLEGPWGRLVRQRCDGASYVRVESG